MFSKLLTTTAVALTAQLVSAQTFTACDPREKSCPPDPAFGSDVVVVDFTKGESDLFSLAVGTTLKYDENGAAFTINKATDAPTITSTKYLFFGKVDVEVQVAPGTGIVTSAVLQSDDRDEIDWEWLGGDTTQVQTNYFGKGDDSVFDRGGFSPVGSPQTTTHTYTIDWTKDYVHWIVDGTLVRELKYADAQGGTRFPQTPCQIKLGTWDAGGPDSPEGTVQWAGGHTDFSQAPFTAYYKKITIQDYSNGVKGAKQYVWANGSDGSFGSINVDTTGGETSSSSSASPSSSTQASETATSAPSSESNTASATMSSPTTLQTAPASSSPTESGASQPGSNAAPTKTAAAAATTSAPTGAAFKPGFSGALLGLGLMAALAL
ncbi:concanavalin A-like lectin/glucanase domain-containing protein [Xylaria nigripes]|nr:concanavalin A-like lectin/glucanase domain-containing protein [Xylaria nigripes]